MEEEDNSVPVKEVQSNTEERKRRLGNVEESSKRIKLTNSSLGLSLLQAYDEDILEDYASSDGEDSTSKMENTEDLSVSSIVEVKPFENSIIKEISGDNDGQSESIIEDNLSSYVIEEETNQTVSINEFETSDQNSSLLAPADKIIEEHIYSEEVSCEKEVDNMTSDVVIEVLGIEKKLQKSEVRQETSINIMSFEVETKLVERTSDEVKRGDFVEIEGVKIQKYNVPDKIHTSSDEHSIEIEKAPRDITSQPRVDVSVSKPECVSSKSQDNITENVKPLFENENKNAERDDYNFCIFGKSGYESCGSDTDRSDSKPVKKVKLNRSKFVRSADESSMEMKFSSVKNASPLKDSPLAVVKSCLDTSELNLSDSMLSSASDVSVSQSSMNFTPDSKSNVDVIEKMEESMLLCETEGSTVSCQEDINTTSKSTSSAENSFEVVTIQNNDKCLMEAVFEKREIDHPTNDMKTALLDECVTSHPADNVKAVSLKEPLIEQSVNVEETVAAAVTDPLEVDESEVTEEISCYTTKNIEQAKMLIQVVNINREKVTIDSTNVLTCNEQLSENVPKNNVEINGGILKENEIKEMSVKSISDDAVWKDNAKSQLKEVVREITDVLSNDDEKLEFKDTAESDNISSEEEVFKDAMETIENDEQTKYIVKINEETNITMQVTTEIDKTVTERNDKTMGMTGTITNDKKTENTVKINEETNMFVQGTTEIDTTASERNDKTMGVTETIENEQTKNIVEIDEETNITVQGTTEIVDTASERNEKEIGAMETIENNEQLKNIVTEGEETKIKVQKTTEISNTAGERHEEKMELVVEMLVKDQTNVTESDKKMKIAVENPHNEIETMVEENSSKIENLVEDVPEETDMKNIDNVENYEEMETVVAENVGQEKKKEIGKKTTFLEEMEEMEEIEPLVVEETNPSNKEVNSIEKSKEETTANIESMNDQIGNRAEKLNEEMKTEVQTIVGENNKTNEALPKLQEGTEITIVEPIGLSNVFVEQSEREAVAKIDDKQTDSTLSDEPSKLEQALTRRKSAHASSKTTEVSSSTSPTEESKPVATVSETNGSKENLKLHLTVQGNRVSIKKTKSTPAPEPCTPEQPRVKRQYRKRAKVVPDEALLLSDEKSYKLRTRTKKGAQKDESADEKSSNGGTQKLSQSSSNSAKKLSDNLVTVEIDRVPESKSSKVTGKVQPIKLKINKNPSVTIECTSKYSPVTIEKIGNKDKADVSEKIAGMFEEARKKDSSASNYMEQSASAWSGPDLQRVERLLKESNITITPVMSSRDASPQPSNSILKPMLTAAKEKSTPKVTSMVPSSTSASIRPIPNENTEKSSTESHQSSRNLNVIIKPLDLEEQMQCWKIARPNSSMDITPIPPVSNKHVDVKSEIRKKIASAERRKQETNDPDVEIAQEAKPKAGKCLPDLLPISSVTSPAENTPQTPVTSSDESTPQMTTPETPATPDTTALDTLSTPITPVTAETPGTCTVSEIQAGETQPISQNSMTPVFPVIPFPVFPKKRGRPTKAMVAAREAYKQSQEAFEQFRQQSRAGMQQSQQAAGENGEMSHFMVPLFDMTESPDGSPIKGKRGRKPKSDKMDRSEGADMSGLESLIMDPAREQEEIKRMEEDRIKREQERDRKNELRRQKAKERSDLVKAKRLRQKMKAEERQKRVQEQKRLLQEEKKKLEEEIKNLPTGFDHGRMKIENGGQAQNISFGMDEDSNSTIIEMGQRMKKSRMEVTDLDNKDLTVDQIAEYQWPIQGGELYMIQEQISNFLGVKSFKRKYPDIKRRPVDSEERAYLVDSGLVSETMCDLGITAVCSAEVLDIMCSDFPDKYEELRKYMREKQMKELSFKQKAWANGLGYKLLMADGSKQDLKKRAMESTSNWNSALNKSRGEDRRCAMDLQTFIVHYPKTKAQRMTIPTPKIGSFPVSILPGQFCDFYKEYTSTELRYFPINTVLYGPLKHLGAANGADGSQTDSDDTSSSDESSSTTSEDTQATEDTLEDIDKDMSLDEPSQAEKSHEAGTPLKDDKELSRNDLLIGMREILSEDENLKLLCKICLGDHTRNKENAAEVLITCSQCSSRSHPTCLDLSLNMVPHIKSYNWQCPDCKSCARCKENADEDKMLFCDICDRGYHIYCVGLKKVPSGSWQCQECASVENNVSQSMVTMQNGMSQEAAVSVKTES